MSEHTSKHAQGSKEQPECKLFAIVVHYEDERSTSRLVHKLASGVEAPDAIVVVDHGDDTLQLGNREGNIRVVRPQVNRGYGAGINVGLGMLVSEGVASSDIVVCMNDDVVMSGDTIQKLRRWWTDNPGTALAGSAIGWVNLITGRSCIVEEGKRKKRTAPPFESFFHFLFSIFYFPYIHGAFFAAPYNVFMRAGGYPDHYFLYWEDVLFSQRVRRRRVPLYVIEGIGVAHDDTLTQRSGDQQYYLVRNGALYLEQHTSGLFKVYWRLLNRARLGYHFFVTHNAVVTRALSDAFHNATGRKKI